ncbi:response regulator [Wenyingzhuangia sp. 2_MG-2023]|nr:response regulator [Wenyingzhuangia sp. 2_MG-2023]
MHINLENNINKNIPLKENSIQTRILVVDDSYETRFYIRSILEDYELIEASNGIEALEIISNQSIDLLITDYLMPNMNGYELVKEVKKNNYLFPIIVITALDSHSRKLDLLRLGIDNYLYKPFFKEELNAIIDRALVYHKAMMIQKEINTNSDDLNVPLGFKENLEKILFKNIENHLFGVEDIANHFNISSRTLARKTKTIYGQTPNQLILEFRLHRAKDILNEFPHISLKQLTKMVGLKNSSYLKKRMNIRFNE